MGFSKSSRPGILGPRVGRSSVSVNFESLVGAVVADEQWRTRPRMSMKIEAESML